MKTMIEVELPDFNSSVDLLEAVERQVVDHVIGGLRDDARDDVRKIIIERATGDVEAIVQEAIDGQTYPTNQYGERKGEPITLREKIMDMGKAYLEENVNSQTGGRVGYQDSKCSRVEWMIRKAVNDAVATEVARIHTTIRKEAAVAMSTWLAEHPDSSTADQD